MSFFSGIDNINIYFFISFLFLFILSYCSFFLFFYFLLFFASFFSSFIFFSSFFSSFFFSFSFKKFVYPRSKIFTTPVKKFEYPSQKILPPMSFLPIKAFFIFPKCNQSKNNLTDYNFADRISNRTNVREIGGVTQ